MPAPYTARVTLLAPWSAVLAAGIGVPVLVLLYMLKLRRRRAAVPTTMLWTQAFRDLEANVPFQRLRLSAIFALQLLAVLMTALALGRPAIESDIEPATRVIVLIDTSASMRARSGDRTRLDDAKEKATALAERVMRSGRSAVMVVSFGASASVAVPLSRDRRAVLAAIDAIQPSDEEADLDEALRVADAFSMQGESLEEEPPDVFVVSDGGVAPPGSGAGRRVRARRVELVRIGPDPGAPVDNVGIVTFGAGRSYEDPATVDLFARVANAGPAPVDLVLTLRAGGNALRSWSVTVPPADERGAGESTVTHRVEAPWAALLLLAHARPDDLPADDTAAVVLSPPQAARLALVSASGTADPFLVGLFELTDPAALVSLSAESFDARGASIAEEFDLLVFDGVAPDRWPPVPSLTIGAAPADVRRGEPSRAGGQRVLSWDRRHPLMRHVALDGLVFAGTGGFESLPIDTEVLATGPGGPLIVSVVASGARHAMVAFALRDSNWPVDPSFAVFMQNALDVLAFAGRAARDGVAHRPGEAIAVRVADGVDELRLDGPRTERVAVGGRPVVTLPALPDAGVYRVEGAEPPDDTIALSILSDVETDIRPQEDLSINAATIATTIVERTAPRELWPWLVAAALVLLAIEWMVYALRVG